MKKSTALKNALFAALLVAGMNVVSSCDSCSRRDEGSNSTGTSDGNEANGDIDGSETPADNENSGSTEGTDDSANAGTDGSSSMNVPRSGSATGTSSSSASGSASSASTPKKSGLTEEQITDKVENSSSQATNSKGEPIISGGTAGTGQGTGTGSTGNNSRVTTKKDQLTH